jgi:prophage maintenance system killer protein
VAFLEAADVIAINRGLSGASPQAIDDKSDPDFDWRLLRDAINRHKNRVEQYPGVYEQGAALWHSLANASPFESHQAETAFLALYAFMRENGLEFDVDEAHVSGLHRSARPYTGRDGCIPRPSLQSIERRLERVTRR